MKKKLSLLGILMLMCMSTNLFAQTLLYEAKGSGTTFSKTGGTQNYTLTLGENSVQDGKLVISAGNKAPNIAISPEISGYSGGGLTVLMKVSNVDVTKGGQLLTLGTTGSTNLGGLKVKNGTTDGLLHATWQNGEWGSGTMTAKLPTDKSTAVVGYSYIRNGEDGGKGSEFYVNGKLVSTFTGLMGGAAVGNVAFGGLSRENSTFLSEGMQIHEIRIYAGRLDTTQVSALTGALIGVTFDAEVSTDGNGTAGIKEADGEEVIFGVNAFSPLTITATPMGGYIFDKWVDANNDSIVVSIFNPYTFNITSDVSYKALFLPHTEKIITITTDGNGTTDKTGVNNVILSDIFSVKATPNLGYTFDKWVNADSTAQVYSTANPYVYSGRENLNVKAVFKFGVVSSTATPAANDGKWYFVQSQRSETAGETWWTLDADSTNVVPKALTKANNQKFTIISTVSDSVTFKSFDGRIMVSTGEFLLTDTLPEQGWKMKPNSVGGLNGFLFPGENAGIHQGAGGWFWEVRTGWYNVNDNCTFFFYDDSPQETLRVLYNKAFKLYDTARISKYPGDYSSEEGKTALKAALEDAAIKFYSNDNDEVAATLASLQMAYDTFVAQENKLIRSTAAAPVWYRIKSTGVGYAKDRVLIAQPDAQCTWGAATPITNDKLFRFEAHPSDTTKFMIINSAYPNGILDGVSYITTKDTAYYFRLNKLSGAAGAKFQIISTHITGRNQLHAQSSNSHLVFWNSDDYANGASVWQFERYFVDDRLKSLIETAETYANGAIVDNSAGNHKNQADVDALKTAITTAKTYVGTEDVAQLTMAETAIQAAMVAFDAAANKIETSTPADPIYYLLINGMKNGYATGKAIYTVDDVSRLKWEDPEPLNANKFFTFQVNPANPNQYRIINDAYPNGGLQDHSYGANPIYFDFKVYRGDEGAKFQIYDGQIAAGTNRQLHLDRVAGTLVYWNNDTYTSASMWKLVKLTDYLGDRYQELVDEMAKLVDGDGNPIGFQLGTEDGNYGQEEFDEMVDAYKVMVADKNSGGATLHLTISDLTAAIKKFRTSLVTSTSIGTTTAPKFSVAVVGRSIVAVGTDAPVQVYTIAGARVQNNNLANGIYVARVAGTTFKVLVK